MTRNNPWAFYDTLIEAVPKDAIVEDVTLSRHWALARVNQAGGAGLAHMFPVPDSWSPPSGLIGAPACEAAALVKSWDFGAAAIGLAVINAALSALRVAGEAEEKTLLGNSFEVLQERAKGKRVAVIGHFPRLNIIQEVAEEVMILERSPQKGDYPDAAAEYLLPTADLVFMTGSSAVNKTMPRLIELGSGAEVHLVGPSVPLCLSLLERGVASLCGVLIPDYKTLAAALVISPHGSFDFNQVLVTRVNYFR